MSITYSIRTSNDVLNQAPLDVHKSYGAGLSRYLRSPRESSEAQGSVWKQPAPPLLEQYYSDLIVSMQPGRYGMYSK